MDLIRLRRSVLGGWTALRDIVREFSREEGCDYKELVSIESRRGLDALKEQFMEAYDLQIATRSFFFNKQTLKKIQLQCAMEKVLDSGEEIQVEINYRANWMRITHNP